MFHLVVITPRIDHRRRVYEKQREKEGKKNERKRAKRKGPLLLYRERSPESFHMVPK